MNTSKTATTPSDSKTSPQPLVLDVQHVSKTYTSVPVLLDVNLQARRGEILGLLGANGAGKSTLLKIVAGLVAPSDGGMILDGETIDFARYTPRDAARARIFSVHQELSVFANLSVAENFAMSHSAQGRASRKALNETAIAALGEVFPGSDISPRVETGMLSMAERQMVEIAIAATQKDLSILIMDEPTSALTAERADQLHDYLRRRKTEGVLVIYVTHKLDDILDISDRLVVLRDGRIHWEGDPRAITRDQLLVNLGATALPDEGESSSAAEEKRPAIGGDSAALLTPRRPSDRPGDIRLRVDPGEIVGIAGLEGAGQHALLSSIYASGRKRRGEFDVRGGVAYVSGDRKGEGIFPLWDIAENLVIACIDRLSTAGFIRRKAVASTVDHWYKTLQIVATGPDAPITSLSGGNQQKVIIARGFASEAAIVLLDDPTRGVDIETKGEFYSLLGLLRDQGRSAILHSTEDREFAECDRVYVMADGVIVKELRGDEVTRENIIHWSYSGQEAAKQTDAVPGGKRESARATGLAPARWLGAVRSSRLSLVITLLAVILVAMGITQPLSLTTGGLGLLLEPTMSLVLVALAQMFIIAAGDFDVGVGFAVGLANVISATVLVKNPVLGVLLLLAMIAGYALMAVIAELTGVPAIVITLGASFIWLGCGLVLQAVPGGTSPDWLGVLTVQLEGPPLQIYLCIGLAAIAWFVLRRWRYGVALRGFGHNRQAFIDTGRSPLRARVTLYMMAGFCAVAAGVFTTASTFGSDINASSTLTLVSIAAVIIGGAEFSGGMVEPIGTILAAVAFGFLPSLLYFVGVDPSYQTAVEGVLLLAAMGVRRAVRGASR